MKVNEKKTLERGLISEKDKLEMQRKVEIVAKRMNPYEICDTAESLPFPFSEDYDILKILEDAILEYSKVNKDPNHSYEYAFCMADNNVVINLERFEDNVIESGNRKLIEYFRDFVAGANEEKLNDAIKKLNSKNYDSRLPKSLKEIAYNVVEEDDQFKVHYNSMDTSVELAKKSKNAYIMTETAEHLSNKEKAWRLRGREKCDINDLLLEAIKTEDILNIYEFGCSVKGANTDLVALQIAKCDVPKLMYYVIAYTEWGKEKQMLAALKSRADSDPRFAKYLNKAIEFLKNPVKHEEHGQHQ